MTLRPARADRVGCTAHCDTRFTAPQPAQSRTHAIIARSLAAIASPPRPLPSPLATRSTWLTELEKGACYCCLTARATLALHDFLISPASPHLTSTRSRTSTDALRETDGFEELWREVEKLHGAFSFPLCAYDRFCRPVLAIPTEGSSEGGRSRRALAAPRVIARDSLELARSSALPSATRAGFFTSGTSACEGEKTRLTSHRHPCRARLLPRPYSQPPDAVSTSKASTLPSSSSSSLPPLP